MGFKVVIGVDDCHYKFLELEDLVSSDYKCVFFSISMKRNVCAEDFDSINNLIVLAITNLNSIRSLSFCTGQSQVSTLFAERVHVSSVGSVFILLISK